MELLRAWKFDYARFAVKELEVFSLATIISSHISEDTLINSVTVLM